MIRIILMPLLLLASFLVNGETHGDVMPAGDAISLRTAIEAVDGSGTTTAKIKGKVTRVCQKKGCWMVMADGDTFARVTFKDYGFFVPAEAAGVQAAVFGELRRAVVSVQDRKHFAKDAGEDPALISGEKVEYRIVASSVELH